MKNSFSFLILCAISLVLILVVVTYYLFSKITAATKSEENGTSTAGNDTLRRHGVNDLASKVSYLVKDDSIVWPAEWQQIGSSPSDCQLETAHCMVPTQECFDLQKLTKNKLKLPVDSVQGSTEKTGYALRLLNNKLEIVACYADGVSSISQEIRL